MSTPEWIGLIAAAGSGWFVALLTWIDSRRNREQQLQQQVALQVKASIGDNIMNLVTLTNTANELLQRSRETVREADDALVRLEESLTSIKRVQTRVTDMQEEMLTVFHAMTEYRLEANAMIQESQMKAEEALSRLHEIETAASKSIESLEIRFQERLDQTVKDMIRDMPEYVSRKLAQDLRMQGL